MWSVYRRTVMRCPMSWLGALYCAPRTVKIAYLLTRAGSSSYSAVRRCGSGRNVARSTTSRTATRALSRATIVATSASYAARSSKQREPRRRSAWSSAVLSESWRDSIEPFSCDWPGLQRLARMLVVLAQRGVAAREFLLLGQVVERRRQAVGAVLLGDAAQAPQRRLQPGGQRNEALATLEHHRMAPARVGERELVDPVREGDAGDDHLEFVADGEVRQPESARRMLLREEDFALGAVHGAPLAYAALQGAQDRRAVAAGVAALQFLQQRDRVERAVGFEQWHDFAVPYRGQRVCAGAPCPLFALRGQCLAVFDAPRAAFTDAGLGGCGDLTELQVVLLVLLHLVVRDLLAGHNANLR